MESLDIKFGKYTLVQKIGDGGMAEVYKARVEGVAGFQKMVALKKIHPGLSSNERFQQNFVNEARLCGQLHHHNVVEVYEFDRAQDAFYLAMEFIDGINLEDLAEELGRRGERLPVNIISSIMAQTLEGLAYAHTARGLDKTPLNVIHRDLKPSNILIDHSGVVKIVDFGVAKADMNRYATQEMTAKGTASYMAPEQVLGKKKLTFAVDVFSAGAILFELLTDERLFDGDHVFAILKQVATSKVEDILARLPEHGKVFSPILARMLAKEPEERATATELVRDLKALGIPNTGTRALGEFLERLEDDLDEGQATIIDVSGSSRGTSPPVDEEEDLFETGPTRVAFMPEAPKRASLGPEGPSPFQTAVSRPSAFSDLAREEATNGALGRGMGGFEALDDAGFEDDVPTRMTTGPTLVQRSSFDIRETTQEGALPPSRTETTNTNPYPRATEAVDLLQETVRGPRAQAAQPEASPDDAQPTARGDAKPADPVGQATVVLTSEQHQAAQEKFALRRAKALAAKAGAAEASPAPGSPAAEPATPAPEPTPSGAGTPTFRMSTGEGERPPNHLARALVAAALILGVAGFFLSSYFREYQVTVDFSSSLDDPGANTADALQAQGVDIYVDGKFVCRTMCSEPITFEGPSKDLFVEARRLGYRSQTQPLKLEGGGADAIALKFELEPIPQTVKISSRPAGAMIIVDGVSKSRLTPSNIDLPAVGSYVIRLEKEGFRPIEERVVVNGETPALTFSLEILPR